MKKTTENSQAGAGVPKAGPFAVIVAVAALVAILIGMGVHYLSPSNPPLSKGLGMDTSAFPAWVNADAMQCQGDMSKLSDAERQKIAAQFKDGGRTEIMASYALQTH